ncbi:hypothetical protein DACRYDRAFT_86217 [Dacryopinax primogenitus]|uniref:Uncharacterized protein n=1 Tax=Dacryopinax primogenitus (strain DJM 731) TaxID=1858805 RepID=M5G8K3_DACPD|nr:uncharacterized protein DACRYDRAFT_86217 [Dacryopinax primogenitus]EJU06546.1 hypothetical protein DACRYDRAFT_86217 [Dacryopinax primogenitus]
MAKLNAWRISTRSGIHGTRRLFCNYFCSSRPDYRRCSSRLIAVLGLRIGMTCLKNNKKVTVREVPTLNRAF